MNKGGRFIISLDFELFWGVSDSKKISDYDQNLLNSNMVVENLLKLFEKFNIEATWAIVGFLYFRSLSNLKDFLSKNFVKIPLYENQKLNNYLLIEKFVDSKIDSSLLFSNKILKKIISTKGQELASHTFSHMYTLENGINDLDFEQEMILMKKIFKKLDVELKSIVFPRNQYNTSCINICEKHELLAFRGNQENYIYKPSTNQSNIKRLIRLIDSYINISGFNSFTVDKQKTIKDIKASRFLRPYNSKFRYFEKLRLKRIKDEMLFSAVNKKNYHLWWHPHNFGANTSINFDFLIQIIEYYKELEKKYSFESVNMGNFN